MKKFSVLAAACTLSLTGAFAPIQSQTSLRVRPLDVVPPEYSDAIHHFSLLISDADTLMSAAVDAINSAPVQDALDSVSDVSDALTVADVAKDTADAAMDAAAKDDGGWWQSYLNVFKSTLLFIHASIDAPLRNMGITQTWGIAIGLFTLAARSILVPLSVQQTKSAEYTKALKPYMAEIKEKFKDNQEAQNRAIAKLFEDANQNPLSGCLLSIAQLPVLLGLYRGIRLLAIDGELDEPFLWIPSLQGPVSAPTFRGMDWLTTGWDTSSFPPIPQLGWETTLSFLIMPVVLVLGQSLTMSLLSPSMEDESMSDEEKETMSQTQGALKFLPLLIGYFSLQVPAGLTIYWFVSNIFSLTQSTLVKAYYAANPPEIELPDYWESLDDMESMSPEERRKAAEAGINTGPTLEDLVDEANFHLLVKRPQLRAASAAWGRVDTKSSKIPPAFLEWVDNDPGPANAAPAEIVSEVESTAEVRT